MVPHRSAWTDTAPGGGHAEGPDDLFALVAGLYAAFVTVPYLVLAATPILETAGGQYVGLLAGFTVVIVAGTLVVRRWHGLAQRLGATPTRWLLVVVPLVVGGVVVALSVFTSLLAGRPVLLAVVSAVGGTVGGGVLAMMASTRYARALSETAETIAEWHAGWPSRRRRRYRRFGLAAALVGGVVFLYGLWTVNFGVRFVGQMVVLVWAGTLSLGARREYHATTAGLELRMPANRYVVPWNRFAGFEMTDDAVVLRSRDWWRLPIYLARSDVDERAVVEALETQLDRL